MDEILKEKLVQFLDAGTMKAKHNKTGNIYEVLSVPSKVKINDKWEFAIIYVGKDKYTGEDCCFVRERKDFEDNFEYIDYEF